MALPLKFPQFHTQLYGHVCECSGILWRC